MSNVVQNDWKWDKEKAEWSYIGNDDDPYMLQYEIILKYINLIFYFYKRLKLKTKIFQMMNLRI